MSWYSIVRRGGTTSTPWDPSQLTDLIAWWKFDELTGTNGSSVTSVTDSAGSYDLSDAGTGPPTLVTSSQNGLNTVDFGTSNTQLLASSAYGGGDDGFSVFVVAKRGSAAANQHVSGGGFTGHLLGSNSSAAVNMRADKAEGGRYQAETGSWSGGWDIAGFSADFAAGTFNMHLDGSSINSQTGLATGTSKAHTFLLGTFGGSEWQGELGEELIVNDALSTTDREKLEGYLAHKWGLTANLPVGHPYKTTAPTA